MGAAMIAVVGSQAIRALGNYADEWTTIESKIKLVTSSTQELTSVQNKLLDLAQRTRQDVGDTVTLYTRLTRATEQLNITEKERLRVTETINKALVVSGASAAESASTITQLSQALASGVLRGEEFNSVSENGSEIITILGKSLGKTNGQLREMAQDGQLTSEVVLKALADGAEDVDAKFAKMNVTIDQSLTILSNGFGSFIDEVNDATGASDFFASSVSAMGRGFQEFDFGNFWGGIDAKVIHENLNLVTKDIKELNKETDKRKNLIVQPDGILNALQAEVDHEEWLARAIEDTAWQAQELADDKAQLKAEDDAVNGTLVKQIEIMQMVAEAQKEVTDATKADTQATIDNNAARSDSPFSNDDFAAGSEYTVYTQLIDYSQVFGDTIDESINILDSFNTTIYTVEDALDDFSYVISSTAGLLSASMNGLSRVGSSSSFSQASYSSALAGASSARSALIANPLGTTETQNFIEAYNTFTEGARGYLKGDFGSSVGARFAQAEVTRADTILRDTALNTYDVQEATKELLESIDTSLADGLLTDEEKAKITATAKDINDKNDILLGSGTLLAKDSSLIGDSNSVTGVLDNLDMDLDTTDLVTAVDTTTAAVQNQAWDVSQTSKNSYATKIATAQTSNNVADNLSQNSNTGKIKSSTTIYFEGDENNSPRDTTLYSYYKQGGYTGNAGVNEEAGIVHGQEYVVNAQSTKALGLNGSEGIFQQINSKLDMLNHLYEINKTTKRTLAVETDTNNILLEAK